MEIIDTGNLRRIQYERTQDVEVVRTFMGIYGVGQCFVLLRDCFFIPAHDFQVPRPRINGMLLGAAP